MDDVTLGGVGKPPVDPVISNYFRELVKKSHATVLKRYGKDYYRRIKQDYWNKKKANQSIDVIIK